MRVLIIEDDPAIAANLYDFLEARGHSVDAAGDGVTGLHLAVTREFDAVVLDLGLPGMDGLTLCRKLREQARKDTPVLMLTARDTLQDKLDGFSGGADDYLVKPFALNEVEARLLALHKRHSGRVSRRVKSFPITPRVQLTPDERAQRWLLSVSANDRLGLLYSIALVLARHRINLQLAKITTLGERVEDTFLVDGAELQQNRGQIAIETELLQALEG